MPSMRNLGGDKWRVTVAETEGGKHFQDRKQAGEGGAYKFKDTVWRVVTLYGSFHSIHLSISPAYSGFSRVCFTR